MEMSDERVNRIVKFLLKSREIRKDNNEIDACKNCDTGFIYEQDSIEKIGQCDYCFEEFKLS